MSQNPAEAEVVAAFQAMLVQVLTTYAMSALVAYECIITIKQDVAMFWQRRWALSTWLFMTNRYLMIVIVILQAAPETPLSCTPAFSIFTEIVYLLQSIVFGVFASLRVFAIWDRNVPVSLLIFFLLLVPMATSIYTYSQGSTVFVVDPVLGPYCSLVDKIPPNIYFDLVLGTRLAVIIADILVLAVTWHKTFGNRMEAARIGIHTPLSSMLLRDGTMYFIALLAMSIAEVLVKTVPAFQNLASVGTVILALQPILISRFLLNLRQAGKPREDTHNTFDSQFSVPGFRVPILYSIIGNMGEELDHRPEEEMHDVTGDLDDGVLVEEQAGVQGGN